MTYYDAPNSSTQRTKNEIYRVAGDRRCPNSSKQQLNLARRLKIRQD
ncbi:hypothetical protein IQ225_04630 [Synechocystis salina LEGE 06155]|nr:hypothetical protein [Synechocystis salina LEGE 06155]